VDSNLAECLVKPVDIVGGDGRLANSGGCKQLPSVDGWRRLPFSHARARAASPAADADALLLTGRLA